MESIEDEMGIGGSNPNPNPNPRSESGSSSSEMERGSRRRLGEMELDAARALADLAQMAKIESEGGERSGRRSRRRAKKGSQDLDDVSRSEHAYLVDDDPQETKASEAVVKERIKVERNTELSSVTNISCTSSHVSCFGRRMKQNMTEAEKEARRIRRVLANRESARQTIRRRQALREELVKRVADLSLDNENMKVEKDLMMKEYLSLRDRNRELKEQLAKAVKSEVDVGAEIAPRCLETTSPSTELSLVAPGSTEFYEGEGSSKAGESRAIFYVPSCAWFYPLLHQTSESCQPGCQASNKHVALVTNQRRFRQCPNLEGASLQVGSKTDILSTEPEGIDHEGKNADIDLEEMPAEIDEHEHDSGVALVPSSVDRDGQERGFKLDAVAEKSQATSISSYKKHVDPFTAAAARKRRKELTKLKYLHARQIRLHG